MRLKIALAFCLFGFASRLFALSYNANYYAVYEAPASGGGAVIYIVPKLSILIVASDVDIPIAFMPKVPGIQALLASDGSLGNYTKVNYTAKDMAALGATLSNYKLFGGDFNGDGQRDLLLQGAGNRASVILTSDASGNPSLYYSFGTTLNSGAATLTVADVDGNGRSDVIVAGAAPQTWLSNSNGAWFDPVDQSISSTALVGSIRGNFRVNEQGDATYSIAILAAPGTAGVTPQISLDYSSGGGDGMVGIGWTVGGLSSISRCRQTVAQDGGVSGITLGASDRFCLDGQRLILTSGAYGGNGSTYRTEIDSYAVVTSYGTTTGNPTYFSVRRKDGSISYYGSYTNVVGATQFTTPGNSTTPAVSWDIGLFQDNVGNPIKFTYIDDIYGHRISRIDYAYATNFAAAGNSNTFIEFQYQSRPDPRSGFVAGIQLTRSLRLSKIRSVSEGVELRNYPLQYRLSGLAQNRSYLEKIYECNGGQCLAPTSFTWSLPQGGVTGSAQSWQTVAGSSALSMRTMDINGDGRTDLVYMVGTAPQNTIYYQLSTGNGFQAPVALPTGLANDGNTRWLIVDINADGMQDLLVGSPGQNMQLFLGGTAGLTSGGTTDIPYDIQSASTVADINGDGLPDLVYLQDKQLKYRLLTRINGQYQFDTAAVASVSWGDLPTGCYGSSPLSKFFFYTNQMVDYDGDGLVDIPAGEWVYCSTIYSVPIYQPYRNLLLSQKGGSTPTFSAALPWTVDNTALATTYHYLDVNGDGLSDQISNTTGAWSLSLNTGAGFSAPLSIGTIPNSDQTQQVDYNNDHYPDLIYSTDQVQLVDYNGDGYPDLVYPSSGTLVARLYDPWNKSFGGEMGIIPFQSSDQFLFADMDGDGHNDLVYFAKGGSSTTVYVYKSTDQGQASNRVTQINNGFGNVTEITYKPLTDATVYTRGTDANSPTWPDGSAKPFPVFDLIQADYVVANVSSTAPAANDSMPGMVNTAAKSSLSYRYAGAKMQASGRGYLGFGTVITKDEQSKVTTTTTYAQNFPLIGQPLTSEVKSEAGVVFKYSRNWPAATTVAAQNGTAYFQLSVARSEETQRDPATGAETGFQVTTFSGMDNWGNITGITTSTFGLDHTNFLTQKIIQNVYGSTDAERRFARLTSTVATHKRNFCDPACPDIVRTSTFAYYGEGEGNPAWLLKSETVEPANNGATTTYTYDMFGNKNRKTISASGQTSRYQITTYEPTTGRYVASTSSPFLVGGAWVDQQTERVVQRNAYGAPLETASLNGMHTYFEYDALGREIRRYDSTGAGSSTAYSASFLIGGAQYKVTTTTQGGATAIEYFDALGRSVAKTQEGFDGTWISEETEYDKFGRIRRQSLPHDSATPVSWVTNTYDNFGRLTAQTTPASASESSNPLSAISNITYDGLHITTTNALGQTRDEWRNAAGELITVKDYLQGSANFSYDAMGQLVTTLNVDNGAPTTVFVRLAYDLFGRKIRMVDSDKGVWFYQYNAFGELTDQYKATSVHNYAGTLAQAQADGVTMQYTHFDYDRLGRTTSRADYREGGVLESSSNWTYDSASHGFGQVATEAVTGFSRSWSYDNLGRVSASNTVLDSAPFVQSVTYDTYGRVDTRLDGATSTSGTRNGYNARGYLQSVTDLDSNTVVYQVQTMDARGSVTRAALGNGTTAAWAYENSTGLLLSQTVTAGLNTLQNLNYTWDVLGNQRSRRDRGLAATNPTTYRDLKQSFCYDGLNRLIKTHQNTLSGSCSLTPAQQDQQYDVFGNITAKTGIGAYSYPTDRPRTLQSTGNGVTYTYDMVGNLVSDASGRTLQYTVFDKPNQIVQGTSQVSLRYDTDRTLFKRFDMDYTSGQSTITYTAGNVEKRVKPNGNYDLRRYIAGVALWTQHYSSSGTLTGQDKQYLHKDILGSLVLITDNTGAIQQQFAYNAWGERVSQTDWQTVLPSFTFLPVASQTTTKGFTGHEMLDTVGLIHMQGRIYDPKLGRFVQGDPVVQDAMDTQAYNRYVYVRNNPLTLVDPNGYSFLGSLWKGAKKTVTNAVKISLGTAAGVRESIVASAIAYRTFQAVPYEVGQAGIAIGSIFCNAWYAACVAGGTYLNGRAHGMDSDHALGSAAVAGVSAYAFGQVGDAFSQTPAQAFASRQLGDALMYSAESIVAHGMVGGIMSLVSGGSFGDGFLGAGLSTALSLTSVVKGDEWTAVAARVAIAATAGGTVSEVTGGKFANGAISAAFSQAFNEEMHRASSPFEASAKKQALLTTDEEKANIAAAMAWLKANGYVPSSLGYEYTGQQIYNALCDCTTALAQALPGKIQFGRGAGSPLKGRSGIENAVYISAHELRHYDPINIRLSSPYQKDIILGKDQESDANAYAQKVLDVFTGKR